ncbi:MAG: translation initiation factor IF-3 [Clostridia bacterium]|nr:translation initiation factor IF-3 [Clostridia bacterium]
MRMAFGQKLVAVHRHLKQPHYLLKKPKESISRDFETKGKHAIRFLQDGNKVKVSIRFRGRELGHPEIGLDTMNRFAEFCSEYASVEKAAKMEGRNMLMFLSPKSGK